MKYLKCHFQKHDLFSLSFFIRNDEYWYDMTHPYVLSTYCSKRPGTSSIGISLGAFKLVPSMVACNDDDDGDDLVLAWWIGDGVVKADEDATVRVNRIMDENLSIFFRIW